MSAAGPRFRVVVNDEQQYALWPAGKQVPPGWHDTGVSGMEDECLTHVRTVWTDIAPRSVRSARS